ncbi:hypothetical protein BDK51DRAFT_27860 [Blyttiomyces helicus]|uniref:Uncharacterized protein n=1 Tax=Blyttiomyces helicus TaxID=388810 RepID=A0A4P9W1E2_9FUNG|nr:hypothetical protein BDK51DRAFT_27860 [Blyttiomyces helicus]|eukprot:RKO86001.1 hypothetical protein BDK51DRAFT_27860 [Blyttiomyces helicus]
MASSVAPPRGEIYQAGVPAAGAPAPVACTCRVGAAKKNSASRSHYILLYSLEAPKALNGKTASYRPNLPSSEGNYACSLSTRLAAAASSRAANFKSLLDGARDPRDFCSSPMWYPNMPRAPLSVDDGDLDAKDLDIELESSESKLSLPPTELLPIILANPSPIDCVFGYKYQPAAQLFRSIVAARQEPLFEFALCKNQHLCAACPDGFCCGFSRFAASRRAAASPITCACGNEHPPAARQERTRNRKLVVEAAGRFFRLDDSAGNLGSRGTCIQVNRKPIFIDSRQRGNSPLTANFPNPQKAKG